MARTSLLLKCIFKKVKKKNNSVDIEVPKNSSTRMTTLTLPTGSSDAYVCQFQARNSTSHTVAQKPCRVHRFGFFASTQVVKYCDTSNTQLITWPSVQETTLK